jgi:ribonuclease BN (tRNA processing enzyme)
VKITVLGGCGAWPAAGQACSGYLVEHEGFRLVLDPGYATLPQLLKDTAAEQVDAVLISHGHPDHCADLNPLLRARALGEAPPPALPVHTLPGAMDAVLALDNPRVLAYTGDTGPSPTSPPLVRPASMPPKPTPEDLFSPTYGQARIHRLLTPPPGVLTPRTSTSPRRV